MDGKEHQPGQVDPAILRLARFKGKQLAGSYGFAEHDAEDIQQELLLDLLKRWPSYDSRRCSPRTFARLVFDHCIAALIEAQTSTCRDYRLCRASLDQFHDGQERGTPRSEQVEGRSSPQRDWLSHEFRLNVKIDVERTLCVLPGALATLCRLLMKCDSAAEVAAKAGISRATSVSPHASGPRRLCRSRLGGSGGPDVDVSSRHGDFRHLIRRRGRGIDSRCDSYPRRLCP